MIHADRAATGKANEALRAALVAVCNAATDGHCAGSVSMDFLMAVPGEASKCYSRLRAEVEQARRDGQEIAAGLHELVAELRARLADVERQRDELLRASEPVADALRDIAGDGHGAYLDAYQAVVAAIAAQPPAEKAEQRAELRSTASRSVSGLLWARSSRVLWLLDAARADVERLSAALAKVTAQRDEAIGEAAMLRTIGQLKDIDRQVFYTLAKSLGAIAAQPLAEKAKQEPWQFDYGGPVFPPAEKAEGGA